MTGDGGDGNVSHRQILRSSFIIGGASLLNIAGGLARQKAAALIVGAAGVALIGLFQSLVTTVAAIAGLGLSNAATRQVAEADGRGDEAGLADARRALFWGTAFLAAAGAAAIWLLRDRLARWALGDPGLAGDVGWLAIAVALSISGGSQVALLTGLRRIGDVARVSIISTVAAAIISVAGLLLFGARGIVLFVTSLPLAAFVTAHFYTMKLPRLARRRSGLEALAGQWRVMVPLGTALMAGGVAGMVSQLLVRILLQQSVGLEELGHYQAAATVSLTYLGFVLSAMGTDYYPRLAASVSDPAAANRLVNEQTEVALLLAGPALLIMLGFAPWVLQLLYAGDFRAAAEVLRWQSLADVIKIVSWPLGFLLLASGDGRKYFATELLGAVVTVAATWIALPFLGTVAAGVAVLVTYLVYLPVAYLIVRKKTGFRWTPRVRNILAALLALSVAVFGLARLGALWGPAAGAAAAIAFGLWSFATLRKVLLGRFTGTRGGA